MLLGGMDVLNIALGAIGYDTTMLHRFKARVQNDRGEWVSTYHDPIPVKGSWQPVSADRMKETGFDVTRRYYNFYCRSWHRNVERGNNPDLLVYNGQEYEVIKVTDWIEQNGWVVVMVVQQDDV